MPPVDRTLAAAAARYRRSGADRPFGNPRRYHDTALEGYFWRITEPRGGTVVIVMASVNRDATGRPWGTVAIAAHPGFAVRDVIADDACGTGSGVGVTITDGGRMLLDGADDRLLVDLGGDTRLAVLIEERTRWPRRAFGGIGIGHAVPGLSQYWHPHLLSGQASGFAVLGGRECDLTGASVYAEKHWSPTGFPTEWWWGQAHGFDDPDVCVAFAGGRIGHGPLRVRATALAVALGSTVIAAAQPLHPIRTVLSPGHWQLSARSARYTIEIEGDANGNVAHRLPIPIAAERRHEPEAAHQHLAGALRLSVRRGRRLIYRGESALAGLERGTGASR
ncbi:MAG TPA: tocopherol cyclase family protein [Solirubrobacteraceae bacterium]|nr:tocopherol cyclase family protein [Solirubrobacteraceae bacterium]